MEAKVIENGQKPTEIIEELIPDEVREKAALEEEYLRSAARHNQSYLPVLPILLLSSASQ